MDKNKKNIPVKDEKDYRGVDMNISDHDRVTPEMVKADTRELNNNPRSHEIDK